MSPEEISASVLAVIRQRPLKGPPFEMLFLIVGFPGLSLPDNQLDVVLLRASVAVESFLIT